MSGTAIFDLDRTLTKHGNWFRYVYQVNKYRPQFWFSLPIIGLLQAGHLAGLSTRIAVKERTLKTLRWAKKEQLEDFARTYAKRVIETGLRTRARTVVEAERKAGRVLILATACADIVAQPIAELLGFDHIVSTELGWEKTNRLTGKLDSSNCYGQNKLDRLIEIENETNFQRPIIAYSDHHSDAPMLSWANEGIAVNANKKMRKLIIANGYTAADWNKLSE